MQVSNLTQILCRDHRANCSAVVCFDRSHTNADGLPVIVHKCARCKRIDELAADKAYTPKQPKW